ncbi:MAG: response regulator [Bacteroidia bacterium]|nr:response regulator [Bacteroidia bacterium]
MSDNVPELGMKQQERHSYATFLRYAMLAGGSFYLIGALTNALSPLADVTDPPVWRFGIAVLMFLGIPLSARGVLNETQTEWYAFGTGVLSVLWISLLMYLNHINPLYLIAAEITVCIFPFLFRQLLPIRLLLLIVLLAGLPAILLTEAPMLDPYSTAALQVLIVIVMNFVTTRQITTHLTLMDNQRKMADQLATLSALSERLQEAEERWSYAIAGNQDVVWDWLVETDTLYISPSWTAMLGYTPAQTPDSLAAIQPLVHPDDLAYTIETVAALSRDNPIMRKPFRIRAADQTYRHILSRGRVVSAHSDGRPTRVVGTFADISAQVIAEEKTRESERRSQILINALPDMIFQLDLNGYFTGFKADQSAELLISPDKLIGAHVRDVPVPTAIQNLLLTHISRAQTSGQVELFEYELDIKGQPQYYEARVVKSSSQELICIVRNITDLRLKQNALVEAKERAEAAVAARSQFLSTMSHEIRTPMNAVIGISHLLMQEDPKPEQLDHLHTLRFAGENLLVIINDILDYSKIESGNIEFEKTEVALASLTGFVVRSLQQKADEKNIALHLRLDPLLPPQVLGDPTRLSQILTNLINNAIKFTEVGAVTVQLTQTAADDEAVSVRFSIQDTGIGIPAEKLEHIFDSFTQASVDHTRKYGGTGLGLAICKRLLALQGSELQVRSEVNIGSEFYFTLKFQLIPAGESATPTLRSDYDITDFRSLLNTRVLLVEDNLVNQKIATRFLQKWDIEVATADNGRIAVDMASRDHYDLILMDIQMPEMDGFEATRRIRALPEYQAVPIIALTANVMQEVRDEIQQAGMDDFVSKPFNPRDLYRRIARYR